MILDNIDIINALSDQIAALLDLMMMSESSVDIKSIKTASEMCLTMHDELMNEVKKIEQKVKEDKE